MQAKPLAPRTARGLDGYASHSGTPGPNMLPPIRLATALLACGLLSTAADAQVRPGTPAPEKAGYAVDGRALGSRITSEGATRDYRCGPSEQFSGFTWCQKSNRERERRGGSDTISSMLHGKDGTVVYLNRHQQPSNLEAGEAERSIQKFTKQFGEPAKISKLPRRAGGPEATIATWGKIELEPLDADSIKMLADGKSPKKGFLLDYLGNLSRSAQDGLPIYRIRGGAGFVWAASFGGRGVLRMVAIDASALTGEGAPAAPPVSAAADEPQQAYQTAAAAPPVPVATATPPQPVAAATPPQSVAAAKSTGDTAARDTRGSDASAGPSADTIARLEAELSLLREQKAQADESARLAAADAAMARNEKDEATATADAATRDIVRLKEGRLAPSLFEDRETVVPLAAAALALLWLGLWLGSYVARWRAEREASREAETAELVEAMSLAAAIDQPAAAAEQASPNIDQDSLVRELGKELGLEEVTAPPIADAILLPDNSLEPATAQQEPAPAPVAAAVAPEAPVISIAAAPVQPSAPEAVATVQEIGEARPSPQAA